MSWQFWKRGRRERPRTRMFTHPGRSALVGLLGVAVAITVPVTAVVGVRTIADSKTGEIAVSVPGQNFSVLPNTPGALLVERDREGAVVGLTVFALNPGGQGGTVVVVPTGTMTTRADGSEMRVGDAINEGGLAALQQAVEGLLGVSFQLAAEVDQEGLSALLTPYAPLTVEFDDVVVDTIDGVDETVVGAGGRDLTAQDAARILLARKEGESEIARLARVGAVWEAVFSADADPEEGAPSEGTSTTAVPPDAELADFLAGVAAGPNEVQVLDVTVRPDVQGADLFDFESPAYVHLLMAQVLPGAVSTASGARVRLVQPLPDQSGLLVATARLTEHGMNLVLASSGGDAETPERTKVEYYNTAGQQAGDQLAQSGAFGPDVEVVAADEQVRGVDLTITLGADFAEIVEAEKQAAATAATTVPPVTQSSEQQDGEQENG